MTAPMPTSIEIIEAASEVCGVPVSEILGYDSCKEYRQSRAVCSIVMRRVRFMTYPEIAKRLNRKSHSGVRAWVQGDHDDETCAMVERVREIVLKDRSEI